MITPSQIYWLTRLDGIKNCIENINALAVIGIIICVALIIITTIHTVFASNGCFDYYADNSEEEMEKKKDKWRVVRRCVLKYFLPFVLALNFLTEIVHVSIPTTKEMAAIYIIPMIANSEAAQQLPDIATESVSLAKDWLKELKPKSK